MRPTLEPSSTYSSTEELDVPSALWMMVSLRVTLRPLESMVVDVFTVVPPPRPFDE